MATLAITDAVQAVAPNGFEDDFTLLNEGPATIFIDSITSVGSVAGSYPLPPTATMVWDADRPLYVVCRSGYKSTLRLTINRGIVDASRAAVHKLIYSDSKLCLAANPASVDFGPVEVGAYNTILINAYPPYNATPALGEGPASFSLTWSDASGNNIPSVDSEIWRIYHPGNTDGHGLVVPARGELLAVNYYPRFIDIFHASAMVPIQIYGTSRILHSRQSNSIFPTGVASNLTDGGYSINDNWSPWSDDLYIPTKGRQLAMTVYCAGTVTAAGQLTVRSTLDQNIVYGRLDLPTATGIQEYHRTFNVPLTDSIVLDGTRPTSASQVRLAWSWPDYEG